MSDSSCRESSMVDGHKPLSFFLLGELVSLVKARSLGSGAEDRVAVRHSVLSLADGYIAHVGEEVS